MLCVKLLRASPKRTCATQDPDDVNSTKTELMLFTINTRILKFHLPRLNKSILVPSSNIKYLDVIRNPNLNWKLNIELMVNKACIAFYVCLPL